MGVYSTAWVITFAGHIGSTCPNEDGTYPWIAQGNHNDFYKISTADDPEGDHVSWQHHYYGQYSFTDLNTTGIPTIIIMLKKCMSRCEAKNEILSIAYIVLVYTPMLPCGQNILIVIA